MIENNYEEEIDATKTLSFIFVSLIITIVAASFFIIPNIQRLKVAKIYSNRSSIMLKNAREYRDEIYEKNKKLQQKNIKFIEALKLSFKENRFSKFTKNELGNFQIVSISKKDYKDDFEQYEINATTKLGDLSSLYQYLDKLNEYENLTSITFPMVIKSNSDYTLNIDFTINAYELKNIK
jgi:hypothetical protein